MCKHVWQSGCVITGLKQKKKYFHSNSYLSCSEETQPTIADCRLSFSRYELIERKLSPCIDRLFKLALVLYALTGGLVAI